MMLEQHDFSLPLPIYSASTKFSIDGDIGTAEFACDLSVCKGACCTMPGGLGAPILTEEIPIIEQLYSVVEKYLPPQAIETIKEKGVWQRNDDGTYTITTIGHDECVFVHWKGDIAYCSIQTAFQNGEIHDYPKPISCHLFPIRIYPEADGSYYVCYVEAEECSGGRKRGAAEHTVLIDYLKTPLERAIGEGRYEELKSQLRKKDGRHKP
ncbi:MAG TPA: DUF3109 family protein [Candidatus Kapabacteria bacterium]|nr:DUF3109 family protein [Candidatus Kapabacteria bacterium]